MTSILTSVKKTLGLHESDDSFDVDVILFTNSAISDLTQIGVGPEVGFVITDDTKVWTDFVGERKDLESVKSYICLKVRLMFDPPSNAFVVTSIEKTLAELIWRLNVQVEKIIEEVI